MRGSRTFAGRPVRASTRSTACSRRCSRPAAGSELMHRLPSRSRPHPVLPLHPPCTPLHAFPLPLPLLHLLALLAPSRTPSYPLAGQPLARPACRDARCRHRQPRRAHLGAWPRAAGPERLDFRRTQVRGAVRRQAEIAVLVGGRAGGWAGEGAGGCMPPLATACHPGHLGRNALGLGGSTHPRDAPRPLRRWRQHVLPPLSCANVAHLCAVGPAGAASPSRTHSR